MTCPTSRQNCGNGASNPARHRQGDPIYMSLCRIMCQVRKEFCEGRHRGKTQSQVAEDRAKTDGRLRGAIQNNADRRIRGGQPQVNSQRYVRYDNMPRRWGRTPVSPETIRRHLDNIESQIRRRGARIMATKAGRAAARSCIKLVPILNVISTAYDVYDIGSAGIEIVQEIRQARQQLSGDIYRVRPDVAVEGANGQLQSIYDFKFDGDQWQEGQEELYRKSLQDSNAADQRPHQVNSAECGCDGPANIRSGGAVS